MGVNICVVVRNFIQIKTSNKEDMLQKEERSGVVYFFSLLFFRAASKIDKEYASNMVRSLGGDSCVSQMQVILNKCNATF